MSVEAAKSVSLEAVVSCADVCVVGHNEVILSNLVLHLRDNWAVIRFGDLW
jgi:hypothetical protein